MYRRMYGEGTAISFRWTNETKHAANDSHWLKLLEYYSNVKQIMYIEEEDEKLWDQNIFSLAFLGIVVSWRKFYAVSTIETKGAGGEPVARAQKNFRF